MIIHKIGHCCLTVETSGVKLLTDPGAWSTGQREVTGIDVVLITHEHADHLHIESLKAVIAKNPGARVITNTSVGNILTDEGIEHEVVDGRGSTEVNGVVIEAYDGRHEEIYEDFGQVQNTGYFIDDTLFYPGDSFYDPEREVDVLALPVGGPWCKIGDAVRYALKVKPRKAFPVHDGMADPEKAGPLYKVPSVNLEGTGIEFIELKAGDTLNYPQQAA
ncbi:MAG: MBL fold metallo-hydrolase [Candidatus Paceibacterota bacterium]